MREKDVKTVRAKLNDAYVSLWMPSDLKARGQALVRQRGHRSLGELIRYLLSREDD
jgi:hypothetical protein